MQAQTVTTMMLAAAMAAPLLAAPGVASASCSDRKVTGTVLGGVGGALIGGALGRGTGALIGGVGGAVIGHEVASSGCRRYRLRRAYYGGGPGYPPPPPPPPARAIYYDQYGDVVPVGGGLAYAGAAPGVCRTQTRSYYDARGVLTPFQVCVR